MDGLKAISLGLSIHFVIIQLLHILCTLNTVQATRIRYLTALPPRFANSLRGTPSRLIHRGPRCSHV